MNLIYQISTLNELVNVVRNRSNINPVYKEHANTSHFYRFFLYDKTFKKMVNGNGDYELIAEWNLDYLKKIGLEPLEYTTKWFSKRIDLFRSFIPLSSFMSIIGTMDTEYYDSDEKLKNILEGNGGFFSKEKSMNKKISNIMSIYLKSFKNTYILKEKNMRYTKGNIIKVYPSPTYIKYVDVSKLGLAFNKYDKDIIISNTPLT
jgi:hypothetical protein